jgi:hypothetical protein
VSVALLLATAFMWARSYVTGDLESFFTRNKWMILVSSKDGIIDVTGRWPEDVRDQHPFEFTRFKVSYWMLAVATGLLPAAWMVFRLLAIVRQIKRVTRHLRQQCPTCGYDLRATPAQCPECGAVSEESPHNPPMQRTATASSGAVG